MYVYSKGNLYIAYISQLLHDNPKTKVDGEKLKFPVEMFRINLSLWSDKRWMVLDLS